MISVSIGLIVNSKNEILITRRHSKADQADLWEFPGGKCKPNEADYSALCRECKEEVGIDVVDAKRFMQLSHDYGDYSVTLHVWRVDRYVGEPRGLEGQPMRWVPLQELVQYDFPKANRAIISKLI